MSTSKTTKIEAEILTGIEIDTIGEILNISMGAAATAIATLLNKQVSITTPVVNVIKNTEFEYKQLEPAIGVEINYIDGLHGANLMVMSIADVKAIVSSLLRETEISQGELDEIHISALGEIMNQMMGSASTALATFFDKSVNISPPRIVDPDTFYDDFFKGSTDDHIVSVCFKFVIDGLIDSQFLTALPIAFTKELVFNAMNFGTSTSDEDTPVFESKDSYRNNVTGHNQNPIFAIDVPKQSEKPRQSPPLRREPTQKSKERQNISVQKLQFNNFDDESFEYDEPDSMNLDLVMGVELTVSVEIGRAKKQVKDVLNITKGSIIELDKQAGDPVDIIVNGQLIAKGDVVVIDDNFGIRITEVMNGRNY
ncbi:MAG: flagellar motor switch protein FliN [Clostridiales bacterium GWF2_38_85]|nr:MAG: flagellar motor switch protein FliN [Clostridiales bacterium GWF2_38_85]HBL83420.1 flagellar motor switch phosphatase FliY [Clostridiales bacterium]